AAGAGGLIRGPAAAPRRENEGQRHGRRATILGWTGFGPAAVAGPGAEGPWGVPPHLRGGSSWDGSSGAPRRGPRPGPPGQAARAEVKPHALFSDGMVLQQGVKCPVWGTAAPGEKVEVSYGEGGAAQATGTVADRDGKWLVTLPEHKAGGPYTLTIAGTNKVTLKDVYVGEVWVCSGQSNMEWSLANSANAKE